MQKKKTQTFYPKSQTAWRKWLEKKTTYQNKLFGLCLPKQQQQEKNELLKLLKALNKSRNQNTSDSKNQMYKSE